MTTLFYESVQKQIMRHLTKYHQFDKRKKYIYVWNDMILTSVQEHRTVFGLILTLTQMK